MSQAVGRGDAAGSSAVTHARDYMDTVGNDATVLFQYRQIQVALRLFSQDALAAASPSNDGFWISNSTTGQVCTAHQPWGTDDPFWDFRNASAVDYFVSNVIGQVTADPAMQQQAAASGARNGSRTYSVFFDEVDQGQCGYSNARSGCDFNALDLKAMQNASNEMLVRMVGALNENGIVPILSLDNRMAAAAQGLADASTPPCAIAEDALVAALRHAGLSWVRFYENWPGSFWAKSVRTYVLLALMCSQYHTFCAALVTASSSPALAHARTARMHLKR